MEITVNGKAMNARESQPLSTLIKSLKLDPATLVVELNGKIVPRKEYGTRILSAGDRLELVRMVGGG